MKKIVSIALMIALLVSTFSVFGASAASDEAAVGDTTAVETASNVKEGSYLKYLESHKVPAGKQKITVTADALSSKTNDVVIKENYMGMTGKSVYTSDMSTVEFTFNATEGLYIMELEYITEKGKNIAMERSLYINGALPFDKADQFTFTRIWKDVIENDTFKKDAYGNDMRPAQVEKFAKTKSYFVDYLGYESSPLQFYFKNGANTIKLVSKKEPMTIVAINLIPYAESKSYAELKKEYEDAGYQPAPAGQMIIREAEKTYEKSDPSLYPYTDNSTPATQPYEAYKMNINTIGGIRWQYPQQSITWEVEVKQPGLYNINFKARKNLLKGMNSTRRLYIDDVIPCKEAETVAFKFSNDWVNTQVTTAEGSECLFYLNAGKHYIKLETTLGSMGVQLRKIEESLLELNTLYRRILVITGSSPDPYRDYKFEEWFADGIESMGKQADVIDSVVNEIVAYTGTKGSELSTLEVNSRLLRKLKANPDKIGQSLQLFKTNIGSIGTWLNTARTVPLEFDYITVSAPGEKLKNPNTGFWTNLKFGVTQFISSFVINYNSIGNTKKDVNPDEVVKVWIQTGRDQFQTIRTMINDQYTSKTNREVNLELVNMGALLPAVVAGIGPDVALGVPQNEPVNFALRNAALDISKMDGFDEVKTWFAPQTMVPYELEGKVYGVPSTQSFPMLFYRKDILKEYNIEIPKTWTDVINTITTLNRYNLEFGITADQDTFYTLLKQNGAEVYKDGGKASNLDSPQATVAFKQWTNLHINYGLPLAFNFENRFRTGEMPVGIAAYSLYNNLSVSAPEIRGLWSFTTIPGVKNADGTINNQACVTTSCDFIMGQTKKPTESWEFLKWWVSADAQSKFGQEMEAILGPSARYPTANIEAFERLPWTAEDISILKKQLDNSFALPEVPGGYFLGRHIMNAFRSVVLQDTDTKETLLDYTNTINEEIDKKRKEFNLPVRAK